MEQPTPHPGDDLDGRERPASDSTESSENELEFRSSGDPEAAELERLYQQALYAMDAVDAGLDMASEVIGSEAASDDDSSDGPSEESDQHDDDVSLPISDLEAMSGAHSGSTEQRSGVLHGHPTTDTGIAANDSERVPVAGSRVTPRQIVEAALFVGGMPLTTKKLVSLLQGQFDQDYVEETIDDLNDQYQREQRPYTVQFGEGGYRLVLRSDFDRVRNRVFGIGPKEIKLSQDALEVLSLVAYKQPISREDIEAVRPTPVSGTLRHLLRRELIAIERSESGSSDDVRYRTTERFLQAFGIGRVEELPQAEELSFK